jgi:hypothetical protein
MPQSRKVVRANSRPVLTDSGRDVSVQEAAGWAGVLQGALVASGGTDSNVLACHMLWGLFAMPGPSCAVWLTSAVTGVPARCPVIWVPFVSLTARVVHLRRKRYHPLYTLQTQGRMHVQMKCPHARAGEPTVAFRA